uniref:Uncharacterized protein n=1 Tax=viral metagenome TaxID=1070528 RepID=A0A6C0IQ23_9ZZZZ
MCSRSLPAREGFKKRGGCENMVEGNEEEDNKDY